MNDIIFGLNAIQLMRLVVIGLVVIGGYEVVKAAYDWYTTL